MLLASLTFTIVAVQLNCSTLTRYRTGARVFVVAVVITSMNFSLYLFYFPLLFQLRNYLSFTSYYCISSCFLTMFYFLSKVASFYYLPELLSCYVHCFLFTLNMYRFLFSWCYLFFAMQACVKKK
jgi:hypothetical protein